MRDTKEKVLVVFDGSASAEQNLRIALQREYARTDSANVQLKVGVLKLMQADRPLDDYLADLERLTTTRLEFVQSLLAEETMAAGIENRQIDIEVLTGPEREAAGLVAAFAHEWQPTSIYLNLYNDCASCNEAQRRATRARFWRRKAIPIVSQITIVTATELAELCDCQLKITCHGEFLFGLQNYPVRARVY